MLEKIEERISMGAIIGIIIAIAVIGLLIGLLDFLWQIAIITLPSWSVAVAFISFGLLLFHIHRFFSLNNIGTLSQITCVEFNGHDLNWYLVDSKIESYANADFGGKIIGGAALGWAILSIFNLYNYGAFRGVTFSYLDNTEGISAEFSATVGFIVSVIAVIITTALAKPGGNFKNILKKRAHRLVEPKLKTQLERTQELRSIEDCIKSIASKIKIDFPIDFQTDIQNFIEVHKIDILKDITQLNRLIACNIKDAQREKTHLEKSSKLYNAVMKLYTQTSREVNKTFSRPLITELEYIYKGLTSVNLMSLLTNRKWNDFNDVVNSIMTDLERLRKGAIRYEAEGDTEETEEERAYNILGIPSAATNSQVKKAYYTLASIWHPDAKTVKDDTRMKQINWAYEFLKDKRKFA